MIATLLAAALLVGAVAILWLPLLWAAIALALVAIHRSAQAAQLEAVAAPPGLGRPIAPPSGAAVG